MVRDTVLKPNNQSFASFLLLGHKEKLGEQKL